MGWLKITSPDGQRSAQLQATNSLGRHPSNSIQVLDKIVSKEHCIIEQRGNIFVLRDLGSLNGTFVNGKRVAGEVDLGHGDDIAMGQTKIRFEAKASEGSAANSWQQPPSSNYWPSLTPAHSVKPGPATGSESAQPSNYNRRPLPPPTGAKHEVPQTASPRLTQTRGFDTAFLSAIPANATHIDTHDAAQQIGAEIKATDYLFRPFNEVAHNVNQLRADYERLRLSYELTRDIADEKDTGNLLRKILQNIFRFIPAQRGVMFLYDESGELQPVASHRNDGGKGAISISTTILKKVVSSRSAVLTHDAAVDFAASKGKSMILNQIHSAIVAPMLHGDELFGVLWLDSKTLAQFQPKDLELVSAVANQGAMFIEINTLDKKILAEQANRDRLSRLVAPNIAKRVINGELEVKPGGTRTECTVYNSDIRGFTSMSENTSPEEIVEMLNAYFEKMVDIIFQYEGTLDKFMGDGIMALWGAPVAHPDDPERAVLCALEQWDALGQFNRERVAANRPPLGVGIAIHTGPLVAGYIGSDKALSYTVIGDVANTSARLCGQALPGQIVVSEVTRQQLGSKFEIEELAPVRVKGKHERMRVFNVVRRAPQIQVPSDVTPQTKVSAPHHGA
jgi:adenylate cyclase